MNIWENTVLTDKGKALQAKLLSGQTLKIKRVTTGARKVPIVDLRQQIDVTEGGYDITLQPTRTDGEKMIIPVLLENKELKESYELWQVGFYAKDPDEGEILFCLAQAVQAKNIPSEEESPGFSITWDFYFDISNTVPFEVVLNSAGLVNIEAYQAHTEAIQQTNTRINSLNSALNQYSKDFLGLKDEQVIRRKTYVGTDLSCNIADGNLYRCSALTINISELGFRTLGDVKAHFLQTSSNSTPILGVSIYGQATKDTVKVLVWTPTLKTVDSISITLECVGTI